MLAKKQNVLTLGFSMAWLSLFGGVQLPAKPGQAPLLRPLPP